jgi:PAS domain S-box-containing protein
MLADEERERLINQLGQNNEQINAAYEQLAGAEEELRYQYNTIASTEEHLRQTTTYLENLITNANVPIIVWSPDYSITRINHSCENLIGKTAKEVIGRPIKVLFPPSQVEYLMRLLQTAEAGVRWDTIEMPVQHTDGTIRSVVWNSSTIYDASGENPVATIAQGQDITVRKRLEHENKLSIAQIQKNLAQLSILNDQIRNPLTLILTYTEMSENCDIADDISEQVKRIDEIVTHLDQRWNESEKILQMLRKNYNIIVSPSVHQVIRDRAARNGQEPDNHSDSSFRSSRLLVQEIEAELFTILDSIDAYIYVADLENYELLYLNKRGRNLFGDITGKTCYQVIEKDQTGPCPFCTNHLLIDTSGPIGVCQSERKNTRNGRWYDCRDRVIRWSDGRLVHLQIATDITDRKAIEDEIRENEYTFRKLYEESSDPILLMQKDQFIECNQAAVDLLKLADKKQLIGSNPVEVSPEYQPDGRRSVEAAQQYIEKAHREGKCRFEWRCTRSDGTSVLLEVSLLPIMFKGEEMLHVTWRDITERKAVEEAIIRSKTELKRKLDAILLPEGDIGTLNLSDIIDVPEIQLLMDDFYSLTKIGVAILDIEGTILVATGWQDICTKFHRVHPETCKNCIESDTQLSTNVAPGTFRLYRCRNNMWDIATPIIVGGVHLGNLFLGQFLFDDEIIDYSLFRKQAREYGFDEEAYIHALEQVPRWSRETVDTVMHFYTKLVHLISDVSWGSIRLARIVTERDALIKAVQTKNEQLKASLEKSNQLTEELHEREEELRKQVDEIEKPIRVI